MYNCLFNSFYFKVLLIYSWGLHCLRGQPFKFHLRRTFFWPGKVPGVHRGLQTAVSVIQRTQCPHIHDFLYTPLIFAQIAEASTNPKHGFGAVDCCMNRGLCAREKICCTPVLKLYSNGFELGDIMSASNINTNQMNFMIKMTPVLKKPKTSKQQKQVSQLFAPARRANALWET